MASQYINQSSERVICMNEVVWHIYPLMDIWLYIIKDKVGGRKREAGVLIERLPSKFDACVQQLNDPTEGISLIQSIASWD